MVQKVKKTADVFCPKCGNKMILCDLELEDGSDWITAYICSCSKRGVTP